MLLFAGVQIHGSAPPFEAHERVTVVTPTR
jgi:hypothetical protein